jgi:hypothetical protein
VEEDERGGIVERRVLISGILMCYGSWIDRLWRVCVMKRGHKPAPYMNDE